MLQEKELVFVIQGKYDSYGWEDLSCYGCGVRQKDYKKAYESCMHDFKEYRIAEREFQHRIIKRYEKI